MPRCQAKKNLKRMILPGVGGDFQFPLGVYPIEDAKPKPGYAVLFESADGDNEDGEWEEWPDRYAFDCVISAHRLPAFLRSLFAIMPGRVYPLLDVLGNDAHREVDPYVTYELMGMDRFEDSIRRFRDYFLEDGFVGFGCMCEEPFMHLLVDEHKIVTFRAEAQFKDKVEKILAAFDLEPMEEPLGADSTGHEHAAVLDAPDARPELLTAEEIVEYLRDDWGLVLNVDPESNKNDDGEDIGMTPWRCIVRCQNESGDRRAYAEVILNASCLREAEELSIEALETLKKPGTGKAASGGAGGAGGAGGSGSGSAGGSSGGAAASPMRDWEQAMLVANDRLLPEDLDEILGKPKKSGGKARKADSPGILQARWLED
jgi:uncharacterized membrane protein YgcG